MQRTQKTKLNRCRLILPLVAGAMISAGGAFAAALQDQLIDQLKNQGFTEIRISRTLLGRVRIKAEGGGFEREIIFNPRTGEILRDFWETETGSPELVDPRSSEDPGNQSDDDEDNDDADEDEDDSDDDDEDDSDDDEDDDSDDDDSDNDDDDGDDDDDEDGGPGGGNR